MPDKTDYEQGGKFFRAALGRVREQSPKVEAGGWEDVATHGYVKDLVDRSLNASRANFRSVLDGIVTLANECSWREAVCEQYDKDLAVYLAKREQYERLPHGPDEPPPTMPPPPYPWVTPTVRV